jgi:hypothetical protein
VLWRASGRTTPAEERDGERDGGLGAAGPGAAPDVPPQEGTESSVMSERIIVKDVDDEPDGLHVVKGSGGVVLLEDDGNTFSDDIVDEIIVQHDDHDHHHHHHH